VRAALKLSTGIWHWKDGTKVPGAHADLRGDATGLSGDATGLSGDATGLSGYVDDCEITEGERAAGVDVLDLVTADDAWIARKEAERAGSKDA
jgi:hypothetical protein